MRAVAILIAVIILLVLIGWVTFRINGNNQATVTVETGKIKEDTHTILEKGSEAVEETGRTLKEAVQGEPAPVQPDSK